MEDYAQAVCEPLVAGVEALDVDPSAIRLELEPGRGVYADAGIHLATVGNVKRQTEPMPLTWVETDSSDAYLPDVNLEHNRWRCLRVEDAAAGPTLTADITGRTCALDVIVPDAELPSVAAGEVLAFLDTGAYQDAAATNFNALPRPGTALVTGARAEMIRRHETLDDVFGRDLIPERLQASPNASEARNGWRAKSAFAISCAPFVFVRHRSLRMSLETGNMLRPTTLPLTHTSGRPSPQCASCAALLLNPMFAR